MAGNNLGIAAHGIQAKIHRAGRHAKDLERRGDQWLLHGPQPVIHVDREGDWEVARIELPAVPFALPIILGEITHNLRSALDHLVYQLVIAQGLKPGGHNYFPVTYDDNEFKRLTTSRLDHKNRLRKGCLDPIPATHDIFKIIESHQPYNRRNAYYLPHVPADAPWDPAMEWLALVHRLWNTDKHRMLVRATYICPETEAEILNLFDWDQSPTAIETKVNKAVLNQSLEDGSELARFRFVAPRVDPLDATADAAEPQLCPKTTFPGEIMLGNQPDSRINVRFGHAVAYTFVNRVQAIFDDLSGFL